MGSFELASWAQLAQPLSKNNFLESEENKCGTDYGALLPCSNFALHSTELCNLTASGIRNQRGGDSAGVRLPLLFPARDIRNPVATDYYFRCALRSGKRRKKRCGCSIYLGSRYTASRDKWECAEFDHRITPDPGSENARKWKQGGNVIASVISLSGA